MKKGDKVRRVDKNPGDNYPAWKNLSINTDYEIECILDNRLVLKNFLIVVNKLEVYVVEETTKTKNGMHVDLDITISKEYAERYIGNLSKVSYEERELLNKIIACEVSVYLLRRSTTKKLR